MYFKLNELKKSRGMKRTDNRVKRISEGIEYLSINELFYVRGGSVERPASRPIDIIDLDKE